MGAAEQPWHRKAVGGLWDEIGRLQFEFLLSHGLRPDDTLLDIGCGSLRGGVHFIRYLDAEHYVGVDQDRDLLEAGREHELGEVLLREKKPTLICDADFDFSRLGRQFGFALAQSLFTHLPANQIVRCLAETEKVLVPGGRLFATFFAAPGRRWLEPIQQSSGVVTHLDSDPYHYDPDFFAWACEGSSLSVGPPLEWDHPRNQRMLVFTRS
jgi:SAM-dependent methyltransferase